MTITKDNSADLDGKTLEIAAGHSVDVTLVCAATGGGASASYTYLWTDDLDVALKLNAGYSGINSDTLVITAASALDLASKLPTPIHHHLKIGTLTDIFLAIFVTPNPTSSMSTSSLLVLLRLVCSSEFFSYYSLILMFSADGGKEIRCKVTDTSSNSVKAAVVTFALGN